VAVQRLSPQQAQQALRQALSLWQGGQRDAARVQLEALVRAFPAFVDARITLGRILREAGDGQGALAQFRSAAEASRGHPQAWGIYVSALAEAGRKGRARKAAQEAPVPPAIRKELKALAEGKAGAAARQPAASDLADVVRLVTAGDLDAARTAARALVQRFPDAAVPRNLLGVIALRRDDPVEAEAHLRAALDRDPGMVDAVANLGLALAQQARPMAAVRLLEPWLSRDDATPALRANLAAAYGRAGLDDKALALSGTLLSEDGAGDPDLVAIRAEALLAAGQPDAALAALAALADAQGRAFALQDLVARATEARDGRAAAEAYVAGLTGLDPETDLRLAQEQAQWGDVAGATARARALALARPADPRAFRQIGLYGRWSGGDPLIAEMRAGFDRASASPSERARFGLALGKALIETGDAAAGFAVLIEANGLLRGLLDYDVTTDEAAMADLAGIWDAATIARLSAAGNDGVAPIFIVGLPRSGSTLIESVLARHSQVTALGESPVCAEIAGRLRDRATTTSVSEVAEEVAPFYAAKARGRAHVTDKFLHNFLNVGLLAAAFPRARFIEAARDLRATCLSIFENPLNPAGHPYSLDLAELGRYGAAYAGLMDHWAAALGARFHRCRYEDLVAEPDATVRALLAAVGLAFEDDCLRPDMQTRRVDTLSVAQVRAPLHTASTERWRQFEGQLGPLLTALERGGGRDRGRT
jgi:predicted Zn-dependent protease